MYICSEIVRDIITSKTNSQMHFNRTASPKNILCPLTFFSFLSFTRQKLWLKIDIRANYWSCRNKLLLVQVKLSLWEPWRNIGSELSLYSF